MQQVLPVADGCVSWRVSSLPALFVQGLSVQLSYFMMLFSRLRFLGRCCFMLFFMMCSFPGAALVVVAVGAGVVVVSAAKAAEDRPIAAATTRANTFFIVIPSICFFI